jgi:ABC-type antimicrobial peptide transport system permease subunit
MNKYVYGFCFFIIVIFAIVGALFLAIVAHELSHKADLEKQVENNTELCFFAFPGNASLKEIVFGNYAAGYFKYIYKENITKETGDKLEIYTEKKSIIISIIVVIILTICLMVEIARRIKYNEAEEFYDYFNKWIKKEENLK